MSRKTGIKKKQGEEKKSPRHIIAGLDIFEVSLARFPKTGKKFLLTQEVQEGIEIAYKLDEDLEAISWLSQEAKEDEKEIIDPMEISDSGEIETEEGGIIVAENTKGKTSGKKAEKVAKGQVEQETQEEKEENEDNENEEEITDENKPRLTQEALIQENTILKKANDVLISQQKTQGIELATIRKIAEKSEAALKRKELESEYDEKFQGVPGEKKAIVDLLFWADETDPEKATALRETLGASSSVIERGLLSASGMESLAMEKSGPGTELETKVQKFMEDNPNVGLDVATEKTLQANPELYNRYIAAERKKGTAVE